MTDINKEWNKKRPDVIAEFVQHIPMFYLTKQPFRPAF